MARDIIAEKLESLRRCLRRLQDKTPGSVADLQADLDLQDILVLNLSRAVQLCVDIAMHLVASSEEPVPATMAESFDVLLRLDVITPELADRMKRAVGFRNVAVHNYQALDWEVVFSICHHHLEDFKDFAQAAAKAEGLAS